MTKIHTPWLSPGLEISPHHTEWILIGIYTRLAFWMPDFAGVNQIGLNKVTWGIPMVISPSFSLYFLQAISSSHAPSLSVIHASFIWWQIASCSNMNAQVAAGVMISFFGFSFFFRFSTASSWERNTGEVFSGSEVYLVKCKSVFLTLGTYLYKKGGKALLCCISKPKAWMRRLFPLYLSCLKGLSKEWNGGQSQTPSISHSLVLTISAATDSPWTLNATSAVFINKLPWLSVCEREQLKEKRVTDKRH